MSLALPASQGTTIVMVRSGKLSPPAQAAANNASNVTQATPIRDRIFFPVLRVVGMDAPWFVKPVCRCDQRESADLRKNQSLQRCLHAIMHAKGCAIKEFLIEFPWGVRTGDRY